MQVELTCDLRWVGKIATPAKSAARLEVCAYTFARTHVELWELAITRLQYRLNLVLGLLRDRRHTVEVFIDKQPHEHLRQLLRQTQAYEPEGWGGCSPSPQTRAKPLFFRQKLNFSGRSHQPKMKKMHLLNEKTEFILSSEIKCPKSGIFTNNYWVGWVGQSNIAS